MVVLIPTTSPRKGKRSTNHLESMFQPLGINYRVWILFVLFFRFSYLYRKGIACNKQYKRFPSSTSTLKSYSNLLRNALLAPPFGLGIDAPMPEFPI